MAICTILVCLTSPATAAQILSAAILLARRDNAHLIAMHTIEALQVHPSVAVHLPETVFESYKKRHDAEAVELKEIFDTKTLNEDFSSEWRLIWSESSTRGDRILESARAADLIVMARDDPTYDRRSMLDLQEHIIRHSGRPVLVIPPEFKGDSLGRDVLLGWSATREATRAAHDLVAVAAPDGRVRVLRVQSSIGDELADYVTLDLAAAFDRHGLPAEIVHRETQTGGSVSDVVMREAFEMGADLIVTGAFGHSRSYDFVIGAVTRDLLSEAPVPVLFSG